VLQTYAYDGYGIQIPTTLSATVRNPFQYGGKYGYYTDHESGFILATYRWYSPQLRRWVSRDPIGYQGGVNLYEYARSNPTNYYDYQGHHPALIVLALAAYEAAELYWGIEDLKELNSTLNDPSATPEEKLFTTGLCLASTVVPGPLTKAKKFSRYENITAGGSVRNISTDSTLLDLEEALLGNGYIKSRSKDGRAQLFHRSGEVNYYQLRPDSDGRVTLDLMRNSKTKLKVRPGE
jgi:RHS repeat-associated protein